MIHCYSCHTHGMKEHLKGCWLFSIKETLIKVYARMLCIEVSIKKQDGYKRLFSESK